MFHDVFVRQSAPGQYTAVVWGIPEVRATAASEEEAVEQVKRQLTEWMATAKCVRVDVPRPGYVHPALEFAGHADPNDPVEQMYQEELERFRREDLERTLRELDERCPNTSSTPTT
jgi:hypothetical protein